MTNNLRYLNQTISEDALKDHKMAFISGPCQVGKTTLGKQFLSDQKNYFNWDDVRFKRQWVKDPSFFMDEIEGDLILFDQIHKYRTWKSHLKVFFDLHFVATKEKKEVDFLVTRDNESF